MAKARKTARKGASGGRKAATSRKASSKKAVGRKKSARKPARRGSAKELNLTPLKKQIRDHVQRLSGAEAVDPRVAEALSTLRRAQSELESACGASMIIPLA